MTQEMDDILKDYVANNVCMCAYVRACLRSVVLSEFCRYYQKNQNTIIFPDQKLYI